MLLGWMKAMKKDACDVPFGALRIAPRAVPDPAVDLAPPADGAPGEMVLAGGCFWCVEAVFRQVDGVLEAVSGYAGGTAETADYRAVCSGGTDHAEVVRLRYDPKRTSFGKLLKLFFTVAHDPTQKDGQGNDIGRQYRSAIFVADAEQRRVAEAFIRQLEAAKVFKAPIATTLEPLATFYPGEAYHQDYAARNPGQPYIAYVSTPKVEKLRAVYPDALKGRTGT